MTPSESKLERVVKIRSPFGNAQAPLITHLPTELKRLHRCQAGRMSDEFDGMKTAHPKGRIAARRNDHQLDLGQCRIGTRQFSNRRGQDPSRES